MKQEIVNILDFFVMQFKTDNVLYCVLIFYCTILSIFSKNDYLILPGYKNEETISKDQSVIKILNFIVWEVE